MPEVQQSNMLLALFKLNGRQRIEFPDLVYFAPKIFWRFQEIRFDNASAKRLSKSLIDSSLSVKTCCNPVVEFKVQKNIHRSCGVFCPCLQKKTHGFGRSGTWQPADLGEGIGPVDVHASTPDLPLISRIPLYNPPDIFPYPLYGCWHVALWSVSRFWVREGPGKVKDPSRRTVKTRSRLRPC